MVRRAPGADDDCMYYFESLIHEAVRHRQKGTSVSGVAGAVGLLYEEIRTGHQVREAAFGGF
jgi:hypothetical protein